MQTRSVRVLIALLSTSVFAAGASHSWAGSRDGSRSQSATSGHNTAQDESVGELLGDQELGQKHYVAAIDYYRSTGMTSAVVANKIGVAYHHMFAFDTAKTYYIKAVALDPKYSPALNNLGAIFYAQENYKAAEKLYRRAIKMDPRSAKAFKNLGTTYFAEGKISRGIEQYREAFALDPEMFAAEDGIPEPTAEDNRAVEYYALARLFAEAGKDETALEYLTKAVSAGFNDKKRMMNDLEFAGIRNMPEFTRLATKI